MSSIEQVLFHVVGIGSIFAGGWLSREDQGNLFRMEDVHHLMGMLWVLGVSFYFYEPISGMTVPADAMGLSAHGRGLLPRVEPRPV